MKRLMLFSGASPRFQPVAVSSAAAVILGLSLTGCAPSPTTAQNAVPQTTNVSVLYAGSMTKVMETNIAPSLLKQGLRVQGEGAGSTALAQMMVSGLKHPDVFISASPDVNDKLLLGANHSHLEDWYATLATDELVIVYSPKSRFASQLEASKNTSKWYDVLRKPGFLFGRTDSVLDPKGTRTILMMKLAANYYHIPGLDHAILGAPNNPNQVFPEETLLSRLETGQLDAAVAYRHEAVEWGLPYLSLPKEINLGDAALAKEYATVSTPGAGGKAEKGAPIVFTISIPSHPANPSGAEKFVAYMLTGGGHQRLLQDGFGAIPVYIAGDKTQVPGSIRTLSTGLWPYGTQNPAAGDKHS